MIIEGFHPNSGNYTYERYYIKGIILDNTIKMTQRIDRDGKETNFNWTYSFKETTLKPDSSLSILKSMKRFNK